MKVYHGGSIAIEKPEILKSKFPKDFGEGFYCTKIVEQAELKSIIYVYLAKLKILTAVFITKALNIFFNRI